MRIEPVRELTKAEYENYRSVEQVRRSGEHSRDDRSGVGEGLPSQANSSVQGEGIAALKESGTKAEIKEELKKRGLRAGELAPLRRAELIDLL